MLHVFNAQEKVCLCFPARALYKTTATCPCPSCDISCSRCPDGGVCPHSEHGEGGGCVVQIKPGTGVWRLEEAAFNDDEQRAAAIANLPAYQDRDDGHWYIVDEALPATANMAGWRLQTADFECLGYFPGSTELQYCRCVDEAECCCADWLKQKEALAKPDAPRRQAGTQRRAMLTSGR
mgnify:FL=1